MLSDLNLIPQTEVVEQQKTKAVKGSTIFSIFLLFLTILATIYFFVTTSSINNQISKLDSNIESLRTKIKGLSDIEVSSRNLGKKYMALKSLFSQRPVYSLLLKEITSRQPSEITIESLDLTPGKINVSGVSKSYISISDFVNNLLNNNFEGGNASLKSLFTQVSLNSVSLEKSSNTMKFFIVILYDEGKLKQQ